MQPMIDQSNRAGKSGPVIPVDIYTHTRTHTHEHTHVEIRGHSRNKNLTECPVAVI